MVAADCLYSLGCFPHCGTSDMGMTLEPGTYYGFYKLNSSSHKFDFEVGSNGKMIFDMSKFPINREIIFTIFNSEGIVVKEINDKEYQHFIFKTEFTLNVNFETIETNNVSIIDIIINGDNNSEYEIGQPILDDDNIQAHRNGVIMYEDTDLEVTNSYYIDGTTIYLDSPLEADEYILIKIFRFE
jgi:hypothetical protein